jgi:hypothetical protein
MRKIPLLVPAVAAVGALLAFGATGAAADLIKKRKIVATTVTMAFNPGPAGEEYSTSTFSGKVGSPRGKCVRDRTVVVKLVNGPNLGQTKSAFNGDWAVPVATSAVTSGQQYAVTVEKAKFLKEKTKKNGDRVKKKIICQPTSETITVP